LDGGNLLFSKPFLRDFERKQLTMKASKIIEAHGAMGLDASAIGPLDLAAGLDALREMYRGVKYPVLCANLVWKESGQPVFRPHLVLERAGVRVGIVGVMDGSASLEGLGRQSSRVRLIPAYQAIRTASRQLRQLGCEVVISLSSIDPKKLRVLANTIPEVDLFVGGDPYDNLMIPFLVKKSLLAGASHFGKYVGDVEVTVGDGPRGGVHFNHKFVPMKLDRGEDPKIRRIVDGYFRALGTARAGHAGKYVKDSEEDINLSYGRPVYVSAEDCKRCHAAQYDRWRLSKHARAYTNLPDSARRQTECLECHTTGLGEPGGFVLDGVGPDFKGVQCEECHGPGSSHPATRVRSDGPAAQRECKRCHNKSRSPNFSVREYLAKLGCRAGGR
jgi:hypothetical protein